MEGRGKAGCGVRKLPSAQKDFLEIYAGPLNGTCYCGKSNCLTLYSPAEPVEKLFFCPSNSHRITPDAEDLRKCMMSFEFFSKPGGPLRDSGNSVDLRNGSPDKGVIGAS